MSARKVKQSSTVMLSWGFSLKSELSLYLFLPSVNNFKPMSGLTSNTHLMYFSTSSFLPRVLSIATVLSLAWSIRMGLLFWLSSLILLQMFSAVSSVSGFSCYSLRSARVIYVIRLLAQSGRRKKSFISLASIKNNFALLSVYDSMPELVYILD